MLLSFWCRNGCPTSLQPMVCGMGCGPKLMDGKDAISAWQSGELEKVLAYCDSGCKLLADVHDYIVTNGRFVRVSKAGKVQTTVVDGCRLESALVALEALGNLDTSWMTTPITPDVDWAFESIGVHP